MKSGDHKLNIVATFLEESLEHRNPNPACGQTTRRMDNSPIEQL